MSSWEGKSRGNKLGYKIFVFILKYVGVMPAYFVLRFVALYYFLFLPKAYKPIYYYFHHRIGFSKLKSIQKTYRNFYLLGQSILDKMVVMAEIPNKFTFEFDGEQNLIDIKDIQKGGLLLSAHIGNWDIAGYFMKRIKTRINIVIFDGEDEQIKAYLSELITERNVNFIIIKNDFSHIYQISDALSNNELVCMHADRFLEGTKTLTADFLGKEAQFPMGPFVLASKFKVPVSFVFAVKETSYHYHLFASKPKDYSELPRNAVIQQMLSDFVSEVENKVKAYPEQWFNYYNFWQ